MVMVMVLVLVVLVELMVLVMLMVLMVLVMLIVVLGLLVVLVVMLLMVPMVQPTSVLSDWSAAYVLGVSVQYVCCVFECSLGAVWFEHILCAE